MGGLRKASSVWLPQADERARGTGWPHCSPACPGLPAAAAGPLLGVCRFSSSCCSAAAGRGGRTLGGDGAPERATDSGGRGLSNEGCAATVGEPPAIPSSALAVLAPSEAPLPLTLSNEASRLLAARLPRRPLAGAQAAGSVAGACSSAAAAALPCSSSCSPNPGWRNGEGGGAACCRWGGRLPRRALAVSLACADSWSCSRSSRLSSSERSSSHCAALPACCRCLPPARLPPMFSLLGGGEVHLGPPSGLPLPLPL